MSILNKRSSFGHGSKLASMPTSEENSRKNNQMDASRSFDGVSIAEDEFGRRHSSISGFRNRLNELPLSTSRSSGCPFPTICQGRLNMTGDIDVNNMVQRDPFFLTEKTTCATPSRSDSSKRPLGNCNHDSNHDSSNIRLEGSLGPVNSTCRSTVGHTSVVSQSGEDNSQLHLKQLPYEGSSGLSLPGPMTGRGKGSVAAVSGIGPFHNALIADEQGSELFSTNRACQGDGNKEVVSLGPGIQRSIPACRRKELFSKQTTDNMFSESCSAQPKEFCRKRATDRICSDYVAKESVNIPYNGKSADVLGGNLTSLARRCGSKLNTHRNGQGVMRFDNELFKGVDGFEKFCEGRSLPPGCADSRRLFLSAYDQLMTAYEEKQQIFHNAVDDCCQSLILHSRVPFLEDTITVPVEDENEEDVKQKLDVKRKFVESMEKLQQDNLPTRRRGNLPKECTTYLKKWFDSHSDHPCTWHLFSTSDSCFLILRHF